MTAVAILFLLLVVLGLTAVFYAAKSPLALGLKTALAAVGFALTLIGLYLLGVLV